MMQVRKLSLAQGVQWFVQAISISVRNPRPVFGGGLLFVLTLYALTTVFMLPVAAVTPEGTTPSPTRLLAAVAPLFLVLVFVLPILLGGLMHVIREAEAGRPIRAWDIFAPFRRRKAGPLALLGLIQIFFAVLGVLLVVTLSGSGYWTEYMAAMRNVIATGSMQVMPQPEHPGLIMMVQLFFNYFSYSMLLLCVPLVLFSGTSFINALKSGLRASITNIGTNMLAGVLFVMSVIAAMLVIGVIGLLVVGLGNLVHPALAGLLSLLLYAGFGSAVLVVLAGAGFLAWRDTFGDDSDPRPAPVSSPGHFEA